MSKGQNNMLKDYTLKDVLWAVILTIVGFMLAFFVLTLLERSSATLPQHKTDIYTYFTVFSDRQSDIIVVYQISVDEKHYTNIECDEYIPDDNGHNCALFESNKLFDFITSNGVYDLYPNVTTSDYIGYEETTITPDYQFEGIINV